MEHLLYVSYHVRTMLNAKKTAVLLVATFIRLFGHDFARCEKLFSQVIPGQVTRMHLVTQPQNSFKHTSRPLNTIFEGL